MRRVYIDNVKGNEILARSIYDDKGRVLLAKGMKLRLNYISKLKEMGIISLYIEDKFSQEIVEDEFIYHHIRAQSERQFHKIVEMMKETQTLDMEAVNNLVTDVMDQIIDEKEILIHAADILRYDTYTYAHSINVCMMSIIMSKFFGYSMSRIKEIAIGALLHDLGKIFIPESILNKKDPLTEEEFQKIKLHPQDGYHVLRNYPELSGISKVIVLAHHERLDGSGYPSGLKGDQIHDGIRLVSICDVFDAMTSDRPYRKGIKTYEVIEYLMNMGGQIFDASMIQKFIRKIAIYPVGQGVILNTGEKGIVIQQNYNMPSRPVVRVFWNAKGERVVPYEIDMLKKTTVFIMKEVTI